MAVPTISTLDPAVGPALGRNLLEISGTGFRLPPTPPPGPTDGVAPRTVAVTIDGEPATRIDVISDALLRVLVPAYRGDGNQASFPAVDVIATNLDDSEVPIPGEVVTASGAYTYQRADVRPKSEDDIPFAAITREVLQVYKRAVLQDVSYAAHTDFSEAPFTVTKVATIPSLHITGPRVEFDDEYSSQEFLDVDIGGGVSERFDPPETVQLEYGVAGISTGKVELQAMMAAVREVGERLAHLEVEAPPPLTGRIKFPLRQVVDPQDTSAPSDSNLRTFASTIVIRGVWLLSKEVREKLTAVTTIEAEASDLDGGLPELFIDS